MNNKAISPVIAVSLLIVVAVISIVGFQNWYQGYQSTIITDISTKTTDSKQTIGIEDFSDNILYVKNPSDNNLTINSIKISDMNCNITQNISSGIEPINLSSCPLSSGKNEIMLITNEGIIKKIIYVETQIQAITQDLSCINVTNSLITYYKLNGDANDAYSLKEGLVSRWRFLGNVLDSHSSNDGSINGPTMISDKNSIPNQAYNFDGVDDYIEIDNSEGKLSFSNTDSFSISAWIKVNSSSTGERNIFSLTDSNPKGYELRITSANKARVIVFSANNQYKFIDSTVTLNDGNWHHIVGMYESNTPYLYVDGVEYSTITTEGILGNFFVNANPLIGNQILASRDFNGDIDEVNIYNRTLSDSEVSKLYLSYDKYTLDSNALISRYSFYGNSNDNYGDNEGSIIGATLTSDKNNIVSQAYSFDGDDYIDLGINKYNDLINDFSFSFWINSDNILTDGLIFSTGGNRLSMSTIPFEDGYQIKFHYYDGSNYFFTPTQKLSINNWHHISINKGSKVGVQIFFDAVKVFEDNTKTSNQIAYNSESTLFGGYEYGPKYPSFIGSIDEFNIFDKVLSQEEITILYNGYDSYSTINNDQNITYSSNNINQVGDFDGVDDYIATPFNPTDLSKISISMWAIHNNININEGLFGTGSQFYAQTQTAGSDSILFGLSGTSIGTHIIDTTTWHNYVFIYDGTQAVNNDRIKLYVDGSLVIWDSISGTFPTSISSTMPMRIGDIVGFNRYWDGSIDEVIIYDDVLTSNEISELYNQSSLGKELCLN